jgi:AcrR family transcriptional regulator
MSGPVKRQYDSSRRRDQARRTRARVIAAATRLFIDRGYGSTSIAAVAEAADVAPQTIYAMFGSKAKLLDEAVDVAMAGDDEPVAIFDRSDAQEALRAPTPAEAAVSFARVATRLLQRAGGLLHAADSAAELDPELVELWRDGHKARLADMRRVAKSFGDAGFLRDGVSPEEAAQLLWLLASPDAYRSCTIIQGWSPRRFERWLATTVETSLMTS